MFSKYHIKPNGEPGICSAEKRGCKYMFSEDQHYSTREEAQTAYEKDNQTLTVSRISKNRNANYRSFDELKKKFSFDKYYAPDFEYVFNKKTDDYGIKFEAPDHSSSYIEENDDGSVFHRFEQLDELFDEFTEDDVREGYSLNVPLNTVQQYVSEDLVEYYAYTGETDSIATDEDKAEWGTSSIMRLLVHKDKLYVIDGNHRFAAARVSGEDSFNGIVVGMDDEMENMWLIPPEHFNKKFSNRKVFAV